MAGTKLWLMQQQRRTGVKHLVERYRENFENIFEKEDLVKLCCNFGVISTEVKKQVGGSGFRQETATFKSTSEVLASAGM